MSERRDMGAPGVPEPAEPLTLDKVARTVDALQAFAAKQQQELHRVQDDLVALRARIDDLERANGDEEGPTLAEMVACAKREVGLRRTVYPRMIQTGKITKMAAAREIALMLAIERTLTELRREREELAL